MNQDKLNAITGKSDQGELIKNEVRKYLRYWIWFLVGIIIALSVAFIYLRYTTNVFKTTSKIQILNKNKGIEMPSSAFIFNRSTINLENEIEVIKSLRISERVVRNLDLTMAFYEEGNVRTTEIAGFPFSLTKTIPNDSIQTHQSFKIRVTDKGFEVSKGASESAIVFPNYSSYTVSHDLPFELEAGSLSSIKHNKGISNNCVFNINT